MPYQRPSQGDVHVDVPLTSISIGWPGRDNYVFDKVFPSVPCEFASGKYYTFDRGDFNRDEIVARGDGDESAGSGYKQSTATFTTDVYSFHKDVTERVRANADPASDPDANATRYVTKKAMIGAERRWRDAYFVTGKWGTSTTPSVLWSDDASTPIQDVRAGMLVIAKTGYEANTLVLGRSTFDRLVDHPDIVGRIDRGQTPNGPAKTNAENLSMLFGVERVLVMNAVYNSAAEDATTVDDFIGGKHALLCYAAPTPALDEPSAGYTFTWSGLTGMTSPSATRIKRIPMPLKNADRVEIDHSYGFGIVASELGYMFVSVVT